ncbi:MAG: MBOAT family protein [Alphaproteobacteria bacterium]|nr:MBOAT family protein [Alphaproteobacteria bacterium]
MYLVSSVAANLGILGVFKYFNFFVLSFESLAVTLGFSPTPLLLNVILPVGISFYTFQTLSYTIDIYRGTIKSAEPDFYRFAAYVAFFPQLVAGPIVRAAHLLPQMQHDHGFDKARVWRGCELVAWGFFLKLCLADNAAQVVDPRFFQPLLYNSLDHLIGIVCFSFQIYGDFAGYSLIAIGLGRILGFDFGVNFNKPYFAVSFSEFWQRWHISLSGWLRDYLYIPLGGSQAGTWRTLHNLCITMFLGGLWHGAAWTFVIWGLLHGSYLVLQRMLHQPYAAVIAALRAPKWLSTTIAILTVFILTNFAWIFFRAESFSEAWTILSIISKSDFSFEQGNQWTMIARTALAAMIVFTVDALSESSGIVALYMKEPKVRFIGMLILLWVIALLGAFKGTAFIYFQF